MNLLKKIGCITALTLLCGACVRDEILPCPPLQVNVKVIDKNYFNIDEVKYEEKRREDLPFKAYLSTLHYVLRELESGKVVLEKGPMTVKGDEGTCRITFPENLAHGQYVLTVWGGREAELPLLPGGLNADLHPNRTEGDDLYLTQDTLLYDAWHDTYQVGMQRTKGKLYLITENFPQQANHISGEATELWKRVDSDFQYHTTTTVHKMAPLNLHQELTVSCCLLAPTASDQAELFTLTLLSDRQPLDAEWQPKSAGIEIKRNQITVLRYVYDSMNHITMYLWINDQWEEIHGMQID